MPDHRNHGGTVSFSYESIAVRPASSHRRGIVVTSDEKSAELGTCG